MFKVSIDKQGFSQKPSRELTVWNNYLQANISEIAAISSRISRYPTTVDISKLAKSIASGRTWSPFIFRKCPIKGYPRRIQILFESMQCVALDFDHLPEHINTKEDFDKYINECSGELIVNISHTSFSHVDRTNPRFRAIIGFDEPITNINEAKKLIVLIHNHFNSVADSACTDLARLFFGSTPDSIISINTNLNSTSLWLNRANEEVVLDSTLDHKVEENPDVWGSSQEFVPYFRKLRKTQQRYIQNCVSCTENEIKEFQGENGESRYQKVWKSTCYLARKKEIPGYIISDVMLASIRKNPYFNDWEYVPEEVVSSAIEWGKLYSHESLV